MTQNEQEEVISKFQNGRDCNLIIATTVAEEGLDIADCNYVIRYDMAGNEISSVQSRGRIRTLNGGRYCSVIGANASAIGKEQLNRYRECLMVEALAKVQEMDKECYKTKVKKKHLKKAFLKKCSNENI
jgi:ERCC4-related helicase